MKTNRLGAAALALLHAVIYAVVLTGLTFIGALIVTAATGGGLVRTKVLLFGAGWLLMAYAVVRLWPTSPEDVHSSDSTTLNSGVGPDIENQPRIQMAISKVPPVAWLPVPPARTQLDPRTKLFLASVFVLLTSFVMEAVFGIT